VGPCIAILPLTISLGVPFWACVGPVDELTPDSHGDGVCVRTKESEIRKICVLFGCCMLRGANGSIHDTC